MSNIAAVPDIEPVKFPSTQFPPKAPIENPHEVRLESAGPVNDWSRWSYATDSPLLLLRCDSSNHVATLYSAGGIMQQWHDPLDALRWMADFRSDPPSQGPPFKGGWIGWISYDFGRVFETIPAIARDDLRLPLFEFQYHDHVWVLDRATNESYRITTPQWADTKAITSGRITMARDDPMSPTVKSNFTRASYERAVRKAIDYIAAGDIFQVNLSQRFTTALREPPHRIYRRVQRESGATHGAFLGYGDHALISNSPELFIRITPDPQSRKRQLITRPVKGTRPRAAGMEAELLGSTKDQAELNMIVDLERNDLGRICEVGSVRVASPREIEAHPTVYHGVATIEGTLRNDVSFVDLLRATFPGGSITGAPKIRAMQIIEELEPTRRGPYCGAIGFLSNDGHLEFNLAIRTMIATAGQIHIPVGAGIVADSTPKLEYEETLVKARAMFAAVGIDPGET